MSLLTPSKVTLALWLATSMEMPLLLIVPSSKGLSVSIAVSYLKSRIYILCFEIQSSAVFKGPQLRPTHFHNNPIHSLCLACPSLYLPSSLRSPANFANNIFLFSPSWLIQVPIKILRMPLIYSQGTHFIRKSTFTEKTSRKKDWHLSNPN